MSKRGTAYKLGRINEFLSRFGIRKRSLVFIVGIMGVSAACEAMSAGLIIPFLNTFQNAQAADSDNRIVRFLMSLYDGYAREERFLYLLCTMIGMMTIVQLLLIFTNRLVLKFSMFTIQNRIAEMLFDEILNARLKFFYKQRSGNLINHLREDVNRCYNCIYHLLKVVAPLLIITAFLAVSFVIVPGYTVWFVAGLGIVGCSFKFLLPYLYSLGIRNRNAYQDANNVIVETLQGIRTVILSSAQDKYQRKFNDILRRYYSTIFNSSFITISLPTFVKLIALLTIGTALLFNRDAIVAAEPEMLSKIFFFVYVAGMIFTNLGKINSSHSSFAFGFEGLEALLKLDDQLRESKKSKPIGRTPFPQFQRQVDVKNLCFEYIKGCQIIHDLSFTITKDQKVAFVGSSGSGKSTLIDILSGFHDDYTGSILIDGTELRDIDKGDWRSLFGYVSQETFIFNDTVYNNLIFGLDRQVDMQEVIEATQKAQIYDTIMAFNQQFETELGERGIRLSGGEKQRIAIAKLFLKNPTVVILDEATSSLDSEAERKVKEALDLLGEGRTVLAVAHRLSTIADYDRIYVLEQGRIAESGNHYELIQLKGHYHRYFSLQSMEGSYVV